MRSQLKKNPAVAALAVFLFVAAGCMPALERLEVADLQRMPQTPLAYVDEFGADQPLVPAERQQQQATLFLQHFFAPWYADGPLEETRNPFWAVEWIRENEVFGENLRAVEDGRIKKLIEQAAASRYPSLSRSAVTVRRCDLRALPTERPLFNDPRAPGQGFPFDFLQHGALEANTPLLVTHLSEDGTWVFVETPLLYGWMPVTDLAWVDEEFVDTFETGRYLALTRENLALFDTEGIFRFSAGIGTVLPLTGTEGREYEAYITVADADRQAQLRKAPIPTEAGEVFPLPLTPRRIANLADAMMGQPYGWGDLYGNRDCSGTVKDLFAPFGLWLPRNSSKQAQVGEVISLEDLTPRQREERLLQEGIPFVTLVRLPGHIMLYLGEYEGRAALLHTLWGVRTRTLAGREGRWLVGKTVITGLAPGMEQDGFFLSISALLERVESMNILGSCRTLEESTAKPAEEN
jgi:hypothetical protein